nr:HAMP domain-containing histidine kinase [Bacteroidota bacterium]
MHRFKLKYTIVVLIFSGILFLGVLAYLNVAFFNLKKEKFQLETKDEISQAFFSVPYNSSGFGKYVVQLHADTTTQPGWFQSHGGRDSMQMKLKEIFINYKAVDSLIRNALETMDVAPVYEWKVGITRFELRWPDSVQEIVGESSDTYDEIKLFGNLEDEAKSWEYLFYKIGNNYFCQIQLFVEFTNFFNILRRQLIPVFIVDLVLLGLFLASILYTVRTLKRQKRLSEMQSDFINSVTHEFNTPLSTIQLVAQTIMKLPDDRLLKEKEKLVQTILGQKSYLHTMVEQILTISMSENRALLFDKRTVGAKDYIHSIVANWQKGINEDINVQLVIKNDLELKIDPDLMTIVLTNLLDNAFKYCIGRKPEIRVFDEMTDSRYLISVGDNGAGIPAGDQKNIFKKFHRGIQQTGVKIKGLGLGLYLSRQIVDMHGGKLAVTSTVGKGSVFTISIPI